MYNTLNVKNIDDQDMSRFSNRLEAFKTLNWQNHRMNQACTRQKNVLLADKIIWLLTILRPITQQILCHIYRWHVHRQHFYFYWCKLLNDVSDSFRGQMKMKRKKFTLRINSVFIPITSKCFFPIIMQRLINNQEVQKSFFLCSAQNWRNTINFN